MWLHHRHAGGQRFNHVKAKRLAKLRRHGKHGERFQKRLLLRAAEVRMKFHITQQRLGVQAIAQAFYVRLIARRNRRRSSGAVEGYGYPASF